jgi:hypothetical protein
LVYVEVGLMSYIVMVNSNSIEFNPLINVIEHVRDRYEVEEPISEQRLKEIIKAEHNIEIGNPVFVYGKNTYPVDFHSEKNHFWTVLKWTSTAC